MTVRKVKSVWNGTLKEGKGNMSFTGYSGPFTFASRFENAPGTNPEELIAAAHAGCYAMALSVALTQAGHAPDEIDANAEVILDKEGEGFAIKEIKLTVKGKVSGISEDEFLKTAKEAKEGCPISKALSAVPITLDAEFVS